MSNSQYGGPESGESNSNDNDDRWSDVADRYVDVMDNTVTGYARVRVLDRQLRQYLPPAPATVLDVGGGAGHQSFPLAVDGYKVTLIDSDPRMLAEAERRLDALPRDVRQRVTLIPGDGEHVSDIVDGERFDAVMCHGVLMYLNQPDTMIAELCESTADGGIVSIMTSNAKAMAIRPAMERRWDDALASFGSREEIGVLGTKTRADTVEEIEELLQAHSVRSLGWYGVWLFTDLLQFASTTIDMADREKVVEVEFQASKTDPYRQMSRVFHLVGRKTLSRR